MLSNYSQSEAISAANEELTNFRDDLDPRDHCDFVKGWVRDGATLVGGYWA